MEAVVLDVGSACAKAGFSGEDQPQCILPSIVESLDGITADELSTYRALRPESMECYQEYAAGVSAEEIERGRPVQRGQVANMDEMEKLMDNVFNYELGLYPDIHLATLVTEPPLNDKAKRVELAEMMFETFKVPALSICNSAVLSLFASGRTRGLVVDCGAGVTHAVPVFEGFALHHAMIELKVAGQDITYQLHKMLQERGINVELNAARDMKEKLAFIGASSATKQGDSVMEYELPDGSTVKVDKDILGSTADVLFSPKDFGDPHAGNAIHGGLADMAVASIRMCDEHIKKDLIGSVVLAGGTTMLPGFPEYFKQSMTSAVGNCEWKDAVGVPVPTIIPHSMCHEPGYNSQRKYAAWIGGSMFASLSTFKEIQVTKQEYADAGEAIINRKCL